MNKEIMKTAGFDKEVERAEAGLCTTCGKVLSGFRDEISIREYRVSGMCQRCQDEVFSSPEK